ncbi:myelin associated glycoprotein [Sarotherodon galilaeus]
MTFPVPTRWRCPWCQIWQLKYVQGWSLIICVLFGALAECPDEADLFITAPKKLEALSGSCLQIPCSFRPKEEQKFISTRKIFGVWIKNDSRFGNNPNNVIFNSNGAVSIYPMSITGNLSQRDCTTLFSNLTTTYTDTYFFRVESEPFKATAHCDSLQITLRDSPLRPNITIPGDLKEKESVTITCSALTPCPHSPPQLTWNLQQDSHNKIEKNTDGSFTTKIQQTITLSDTHDGKKISCSARYPVNQGKDTKTAETEETLSVSYAPKDTSASISPSGLVSAGSWVKLTCSSRAKPPVSSFTWFKKSRDGAVKVSEGEIYSFNVTDGGVYYCVATNNLGNQTSAEIRVTVKGMIKPVLWGTAIGAIIGIIILICMVFILCLSLEEAARTAENEDVHYNEIEFSKQRPSLDSVQDSTQQQDVVYSQVKERKTEKRLTQTSDGEYIYCQVQKN